MSSFWRQALTLARSLWLFVAVVGAGGTGDLRAEATLNDFSGGAAMTPYTTKTWGTYSGGLLLNGSLRLTYATAQSAVVMFDRSAEGPHRQVSADFRISCNAGSEGLSLNLLDTGTYGTRGLGPFASMNTSPTRWEEPTLGHSLAIAFDVSDPDDYQGLGAHEVSLHWNGVELAKRRSTFDFRTGSFVSVHSEIHFVPGGAEISVKIGTAVVYDREFVAGPEPFEARVAFGSRTGAAAMLSRLDDVAVHFSDPYVVFAPPIAARLFNREWIHGGNQTPEELVTMPVAARPWERVLLRMSLDRPPNGFDVFDRQMNFMVTAAGKRFEIARFITPFGQAGTWTADVTEFQSLFKDSRRFRAFIATYVPQSGGQYGSGWLVTADLLFYAGEPEFVGDQVVNLWSGEPQYGNPASPISKFFTPRSPIVDPNAERVQLRLMVTGHGQSPNSENAAEFLLRGRTLTVGTTSFRNILWRSDCYLNPNRPQPGTWIYSRAGWCPGDRVQPWVVDISSLVTPGSPINLTYVADAYNNTSIDGGNPARHWVESQMITFRRNAVESPHLEVETGDATLSLRWPAWAHRWGVSTSSRLDGDWTRVPQTPLATTNQFEVRLAPSSDGPQFYRLQPTDGL